MHLRTRLRRKDLPKWPKELGIKCMDYRTTWCGISTRKRSLETHRQGARETNGLSARKIRMPCFLSASVTDAVRCGIYLPHQVPEWLARSKKSPAPQLLPSVISLVFQPVERRQSTALSSGGFFLYLYMVQSGVVWGQSRS